MTHVFIRNPAGENFPLFARRPEKASLNISRCLNFMILKILIQKTSWSQRGGSDNNVWMCITCFSDEESDSNKI